MRMREREKITNVRPRHRRGNSASKNEQGLLYLGTWSTDNGGGVRVE